LSEDHEEILRTGMALPRDPGGNFLKHSYYVAAFGMRNEPAVELLGAVKRLEIYYYQG
jgi:hypothetical protein